MSVSQDLTQHFREKHIFWKLKRRWAAVGGGTKLKWGNYHDDIWRRDKNAFFSFYYHEFYSSLSHSHIHGVCLRLDDKLRVLRTGGRLRLTAKRPRKEIPHYLMVMMAKREGLMSEIKSMNKIERNHHYVCTYEATTYIHAIHIHPRFQLWLLTKSANFRPCSEKVIHIIISFFSHSPLLIDSDSVFGIKFQFCEDWGMLAGS